MTMQRVVLHHRDTCSACLGHMDLGDSAWWLPPGDGQAARVYHLTCRLAAERWQAARDLIARAA